MLRSGPAQPDPAPGSSTDAAPRFRVGRWEVDPGDGTLRSEAETVRLEPRVAQVLLALVRQAGEVVSRDALMQEVWGDTHVAPIAVSRCISQLRTAFGDTDSPRRYIETLPKRGYRLVARVTYPGAAPGNDASAPAPAKRRRPGLAAAAAIALVAVAGYWLQAPDDPGADPAVAQANSGGGTVDDLVARAQSYYDRQRFQDNENAIALFEQAIALDAGHAEARAGLANAYAKKARYTGYEPPWIARAEAEAREAIALDRLNPRTHKALGLVLSTRGALRGAIASYRQALKLEPDYDTALTNLAVVLWQAGEWDESLRYAMRAVDRTAPSVTSVDNVADMLDALGFRERGAAWRRWALSFEPNRVGTVVDQAYNDVYDGSPDRARDRIAELDTVVSDCRSCLVLWIDIEFLTGNVEAAAPYVRAYHDLYPEGRLANIRLATVLAHEDPAQTARILAGIEAEVTDYIDNGADWWTGPWAMAMVSAIRRDREATLYWFERTIDAGRFDYRFDSRDVRYAFLAGDPEFEALVQRQRDRVAEMRQRVIASGLLDEFPDPPTLPIP